MNFLTATGFRFCCAVIAVLGFASVADAAVTLNVALGPDPVRLGEVVHSEITVANNGGSAVANITVRITIPTTVTAFSSALFSGGPGTLSSCTASGTSGCDPSEIITWTIGTLPAGASATMTFPAVVTGTNPNGTLVTLDTELLINAISSATASRTVTALAANALSLYVDDRDDSVAPGAALTYNLTYGNRGGSSLTSTTLTFPVPAGTTFVSASGGGSFAAGVVTWNLGTLTAGDSGRQQVVVTTGAGLADGAILLVDAAAITGTGAGLESATARAITAVRTSQPLGVGLEVNPDPVRPLEPMHLLLTVSNRSGSALSNVKALLRMPDTIVAFSSALFMGGAGTLPGCSGFGTSNCDTQEVVTWTLGTLPAGANATMSLPPILAAGILDGRLTNWEVIILADNNTIARASRTVVTDSNNALSLHVDDRDDSVVPGAALTYDVTYGNRGGSSLTGTTLTFPVPTGTSFVSASGGGSFAAGVVTWNLGTLVAGDAGRQQVVVTAGAGLTDGALLVVDPAAITGTGAIQENAHAVAVTAVRASQPLGVALEVNPDPARTLEPMHARITVTNRSGSALSSVTALLRVPDTIVAFSSALFMGGPGTLPGCTVFGTSNCDLYEPLTWAIGPLPAGASATLSLPPNLAATIVDGRLTGWEVIVLGDNNAIARASHTVIADNGSALSLSADENFDPVAPGAALTYNLTYGNRGISSLTGTTLTFPIPAGTTFVSASGGGSFSAGVVTWNLGTLVAGDSGRQQVVVTVGAGLTDGALLVVDAAAITGTGAIQENTHALAVTAVRTSQPLGLGLEVNPDPARPLEPMHARITVTNRSGSALSNVKAVLRVPDTIVAFSSALFMGGPGTLPSCIAFGTSNCDLFEVLSWTIGTLPAGAGATLSLPPNLAPGIEDGRLTGWEVLVLADSNTIARLSHTVATDSTNPLLLDVDDSVDAVPTGANVTYELTYGNRGVSSLTGATLSFPIPAGATLVSNTGGTVTGNAIDWSLGTLTAGQGGKRRVVVSVGAGANPGDILAIDAAAVSGVGAIAKTARGTAVSRIATAPVLRLVSGVSPNPIQPGQTLTNTLTLTNTTGSSLSGVVLHVRVPNFVTGFSSALIAPAGPSCTGFGTSNCDISEVLTWTVGILAPNASFVASIPPVVPGVSGAPVNGQLIPITALAEDGSGNAAATTNTVLVNPFTDTDVDGIAQVFDNCTAVANADQRDTNGDGYGNICDPDFNGDLTVNINDFNRLKARLNIVPVVDVDTDLDGNGAVNINDFNRLKSFLGKPPGPSALAP